MEADPAPPIARPGRRPCFCCGQPLGQRQRARHRVAYVEQLNAQIANLGNPEAGGGGIVPDDNGMNPGGDADAAPGFGLAVADLDGNGMDVEGGAADGPGLAADLSSNDMEVEEGAAHDLVYEDPFAGLALDRDDDPPALPLEPEYEIILNPPVLIHDWAAPGDDGGFEAERIDDEPDNIDEEPSNINEDDPDQDPAYNEPEPRAFGELDPINEPRVPNHELRAVLDRELGDLAEQQWIDIFDEYLRARDRNMLKFLATRLRTHFSRQTWDELRFGACEAVGLPSEYVAWRRLRVLAGLELCYYDCCIKSCICFLGKYSDLRVCSYCGEPRYNSAGYPRRQFAYTPLIPQLQALFRDRDMIEKLGHRARAEAAHEPGVYHEIFDGETYRTLRNTRLNPDHDYCFFDNPEDLALGLSTDGFTLSKRRRRGLSTAWPLIIIIYNLHPSIRTRLENVICVGVIPGPTQCKDINSFLIPLLEELLLLERGVESVKAPPAGQPNDVGIVFVLRAFMIMLFGDIPAVSKLLAVKGHSGKVPCRTCYMQGVPYRYPRVTTYYTPLTIPGEEQGFPPHLLFLRTHGLFHLHYRQLEALDRQPARRAELAMDLGINARPIFGRLKAIDLSTCAPYDIMHLLFENLVPNMIAHWTGQFKGLDQGTEHYQLAPGLWTEIGRLTHAAARTIPSAFVGTLPDISKDQNLYKAEAYSFWFQYIGPIVLKGRLAQPYYDHYVLAREIVIRCVQLKITDAQIDELEEMIREWVANYERFYYQYNYERLRACPLTIHALLHMPHYIRHTGPLCGSWAFVMERFCGRLLPAVKNRYQPYTHLDNYVARRAQMQAVCLKYGLPRLGRSTVKWRYEGGERLSQHEKRDPDFPNIILGRPMVARIPVDRQIRDLMTRYFNPIYNPDNERPLNEIRAQIEYDNISSYGRFRMADDGDRIRTAGVVERGRRAEADARDNSFVRFTALPDKNASNNGTDIPYEEVFYGRLMNIYRVNFIEDIENEVRVPYLLARIKICKDTDGIDAALPGNTVEYRSLDSDELFHIELINAVVGRVPVNHNTWGIIDPSRDGARTQFRDDDNNDSDSDNE